MRNGLPLLKQFEGCKLIAYQDIVGIWTIGYGETKGVYKGMTITQSQADSMVQNRYDEFETSIKKLLRISVTDNELGALTCFAYNIGLSAFTGSTLLKLLNNNTDRKIVAAEFIKWNKAGGKVVDGLTRRRIAEANLFLTK